MLISGTGHYLTKSELISTLGLDTEDSDAWDALKVESSAALLEYGDQGSVETDLSRGLNSAQRKHRADVGPEKH
jgi:hypothetical protein